MFSAGERVTSAPCAKGAPRSGLPLGYALQGVRVPSRARYRRRRLLGSVCNPLRFIFSLAYRKVHSALDVSAYHLDHVSRLYPTR